MVRFALTILLMVLPQEEPATPANGSASIDSFVSQKWTELKISPAPRSDDTEFLRRATLDIIGVIPRAEEILAFLADRSLGKRARKIDELLSHEKYASSWAKLWENILLDDAPARDVSEISLNQWLHEEVFAKNMPYDRMVRELLTAEGINQEQGATNFIIRFLQRNQPP